MWKNNLRPKLTVQFYTQDKCFGPGVALLLSRVQEHHSLRAASMSVGMAYSKAWTIMKHAEQELGMRLLNSTTGGKRGGGATLTPEGERLLADYTDYVNQLNAHSEALFQEKFSWLTE